MLKNIIVVLDRTESSAVARRFGVDIATHTNAELVGLSVVDAPWIAAPRSTPIGGAHFQAHRNQSLLLKGRQDVRALLAEFEAECKAAGARYIAVGREGDPVEQIDDESDKADLIILGRETNFHGDASHDIGDIIDRLLDDTARPLVIAPERLVPSRKSNVVLVAFDGSSTASRAMHMFILLGLADGKEIHVASVGEDAASARATAERGATLFRNHGVHAISNPVVDAGGHSGALMGAAASINAGLLVMGARGQHSLLRRALVGSTTIAMLRAATLPIFVHH